MSASEKEKMEQLGNSSPVLSPVSREQAQTVLKALRVARRWIVEDGPEIGWSIDRLDEVIAAGAAALRSPHPEVEQKDHGAELAAVQTIPDLAASVAASSNVWDGAEAEPRSAKERVYQCPTCGAEESAWR